MESAPFVSSLRFIFSESACAGLVNAGGSIKLINMKSIATLSQRERFMPYILNHHGMGLYTAKAEITSLRCGTLVLEDVLMYQLVS